jgi:glucose/arabinose dehydrogenase/cytochrome c551/c552/type 1 glutamine amidotransferase
MKRFFLPRFALLCTVFFFASCNQRSGKSRVLVFTKTAGYHHASIPAGVSAIIKLGTENNFAVDTTSDANYFNEDSLGKYAAVIFLSTTGDLLNNYQEADFERYIQSGGGYVGIHAAADAEYDWGWYGRLVGGYFLSHPAIQEAELQVVDSLNPATKHLPHIWKRTDEWYNYKKMNPDVHVLLKINEKSYQGGTMGDSHPMAWYHDFDGGRAFYTELGHTEESYSDPLYLKHILGGIEYAIGGNKKLDYSKATTLRVPEEDRFTKTQLATGTFFEPTEMTILPNLDIIVVQRRGEIMLYKQKDQSVKQIGYLDVYWKTSIPGVNAEEGLLGIQADPDFSKNHFVYIYYSPKDTSVNRLSRFTFTNDKIDLKSEKIILQLYSQREICCHTGGSIAFGNDHTLFLSTGGNSTPFDEKGQPFLTHGFAPLDDRPGHLQYDVQRSAGNTNDLRGKILRIKINENGSYDIPANNLFPVGTAKTRPEIYVMGDRNPYRISVDKHTGFLYWGEVGPDAKDDSLETRGPRGYDEINQARKAGFFGWPYFVGNNYAYRAYDYSNGKSGDFFDPAHPVNNSRNNTGLQNLPPAQPAFIWYPYANSTDFPQVGSGGRTAMAGPVYYTKDFPEATRLPEYYNKKLFIYDWIRGWIKVVTMKENGDFDKMEPFMEHTKFTAPIDMEVGPDGKIYVLDYGQGWFNKNPDAGLYRIDYNGGNRPPVVSDVTVDKSSGMLPLTVTASVVATDPEKDQLTYTWHFGNKITKETKEPKVTYTFNKPGDYTISVNVKDSKNAEATSQPVNVYAGNEAPVVNVKIEGNQTFYFPGKKVKYSVVVKDKNDLNPETNFSNLMVMADYSESARAASSQGHQTSGGTLGGYQLMLSLDCKSCHNVSSKSVGPSFDTVAKYYQKRADAMAHLTEKIIKGGSGVWGEVAMAAHPTLKQPEAAQIVKWIQSLATSSAKSLPATGELNPTLQKPENPKSKLSISASYTDRGGAGIKTLSGFNAVVLQNSKLDLSSIKSMKDFSSNNFNGMSYLLLPKNAGWFAIDSIDLTGINKMALTLSWLQLPVSAYTFEVHLDEINGRKIGEFIFPGKTGNTGKDEKSNKPQSQIISNSIQPVNDGKLHNVYIVGKINGSPQNDFAVSGIQFFLK